MPSTIKPHIALILANLLFGLNYSYSKTLLPDYMSPANLAVTRVLFATLMFWIVLFATGKWRVQRKDMPHLFLSGVFGVVGNQFLFLKGLSYTTPIDAVIIGTLLPIVVLLLSRIFYGEKITFWKLVGVIVGCTGALIIILGTGHTLSFSSENFVGNIMIFGSVLCYSCYLVYAKPMLAKYEPMTVMGWIFLTGTIVMPLLVGSDNLTFARFYDFPGEKLFAYLFVLIGATVVAYAAIAYGLKNVKPTTVGIYAYSQPVVASLFAVIRGQDSLSFMKIVSAVMVFAGVFIITQSHRFGKR